MIRWAQPNPHDLEGVWRLGRMFHAEFHRVLAPLDAEKAFNQIAWHIDHHPALVAEQHATIVGALLVHEIDYWYSAERMLTDTLFYVEPAARGGTIARGLIRKAAALARECGCRLQLTTSSGLVGPAIDRFYGSLGLRRIGAAYLME